MLCRLAENVAPMGFGPGDGDYGEITTWWYGLGHLSWVYG